MHGRVLIGNLCIDWLCFDSDIRKCCRVSVVSGVLDFMVIGVDCGSYLLRV